MKKPAWEPVVTYIDGIKCTDWTGDPSAKETKAEREQRLYEADERHYQRIRHAIEGTKSWKSRAGAQARYRARKKAANQIVPDSPRESL